MTVPSLPGTIENRRMLRRTSGRGVYVNVIIRERCQIRTSLAVLRKGSLELSLGKWLHTYGMSTQSQPCTK